jgi:cystathionine beta-lyase/cystathionine gamma-synthase
MHLVRAGESFIAPPTLYSGSVRFFRDILPRYGVECRFVDLREPGALKAAADAKTRALYLESPDNPLLRMHDVEALINEAHALGLRVVFDNTFNTPLLFRPMEWGADVVVHSATKYLSGHGHVIGGIILARDAALLHEIHHETVYNFGATMSPFNAWLLLHCESALAVARFLEAQPKVAWVNYPRLASHPEHALARKYLPKGCGGMVAFGLKGGADACSRALDAVRLVTHQVSLGDAKSLMIHPFSMMFETLPEDERRKLGILPEMLRLSVGLEDARDLIADLAQALERE